MTKKSGNTPQYRKAKRITAFVSPSMKSLILASAKKNNRSMSEEIGEWLAIANVAKNG